MGLTGWVKRYLEMRYPTCFGFSGPGKDLGVLTVDMMQFVKGALNENIKTQANLLSYFRNKVVSFFDLAAVIVICFDRASPDVKSIVCHTKRYERRCSKCKKMSAELPKGKTAGPEHFSTDCEKDCYNSQILWREDGPHLDVDDSQLLWSDWMKFASDSRNLHDELYPRLANVFLSINPPIGKALIIHGLPFKTKTVYDYSGDIFLQGSNINPCERVILDYWSPDLDLPLKEKPQDHIVLLENNKRTIESKMSNSIHEADNAVFYYARFYPHFYKHMAYINDGDAFSIGIFRAIEDFLGARKYSREYWLCLPYKGSKKRALFGNPDNAPKFQYVNLTKLAQDIEDTPEFQKTGIQSPVATMVFLIILSDTDFFQGEFCHGIGGKTEWKEDAEKRKNQTKGIWDTFFDNLQMFSHLVQYYPNVKSETDERRIVLDEDLFSIFTQYCYTNKYAVAARKKQKIGKDDNVTYSQIQAHCFSMKDPRKRAPNEQTIQRWARQIAWNLNYWVNAWRDIYIDPFEKYQGESYYGYTQDEKGKKRITNVIATKQKPLDEVYKLHFWKRRQKTVQHTAEPIPQKRKFEALELIRGK